MFISGPITAGYFSLSCARLTQSTPPIVSVIILSSHLRLGLESDLSPQVSPHNSVRSSPLHMHAWCFAHLIVLDVIIRLTLREDFTSRSSSLYSFLQSPVTSSVLGRQKFRCAKFITNYYKQ